MPVLDVEVQPVEVIEALPPLTITDHLNLAASLIEEYGWTQRSFGNKQQGFCILGAVYETYDSANPPNNALASTVLSLYTLKTYGCTPDSLNDHVLTSAEEAITILRQAAKESRCQ